jgi:hypothetical protein
LIGGISSNFIGEISGTAWHYNIYPKSMDEYNGIYTNQHKKKASAMVTIFLVIQHNDEFLEILQA